MWSGYETKTIVCREEIGNEARPGGCGLGMRLKCREEIGNETSFPTHTWNQILKRWPLM